MLLYPGGTSRAVAQGRVASHAVAKLNIKGCINGPVVKLLMQRPRGLGVKIQAGRPIVFTQLLLNIWWGKALQIRLCGGIPLARVAWQEGQPQILFVLKERGCCRGANR